MSDSRKVPLILAPLLGVTTHDFRKIFAKQFGGFDKAVSPFIVTTSGNPATIAHFRDVLPQNNIGSIPLVPQLIGKNPTDFIAASSRLHSEFGYSEINWNIGCPAPTVITKTRGAGLLTHPDIIEKFLETVFASKPQYSFSVKMRIGREDPDDFLKIIPILNRFPLVNVTLHPRTAAQMYGGSVDMMRFEIMHDSIDHPIIYNGDIKTAEDARRILVKFPKVSALMIGRGAVIDPTLPIRITDPQSPSLSVNQLKNFHDEIFSTYQNRMEGGVVPILGRMKELWKYWAVNFGDSERSLRQILKSDSFCRYDTTVSEIFEKSLQI